MKSLGCLFLTVLLSVPCQASICLRAPKTQVADYQVWLSDNPQCQSSEELLLQQMQTDPDADLEILSSKLEKAGGVRSKQNAVFREFFEIKKRQAWSKRTVEVVVEVLKRWSQQSREPEDLQQVLRQLSVSGSPSGNQLAKGGSSPGLYQTFNSTAEELEADWQDGVIYRNGEKVKGLFGQGRSHWVIFSPLYRPVILWGTAAEARQKIRKDKRPWLTGICEKAQLNFNTVAGEDYLFLYPNGCVANRPALVLPIHKGEPTLASVQKPQTAFYESKTFWAVTALSALVVSAALKNKTVTIRAAK